MESVAAKGLGGHAAIADSLRRLGKFWRGLDVAIQKLSSRMVGRASTNIECLQCFFAYLRHASGIFTATCLNLRQSYQPHVRFSHRPIGLLRRVFQLGACMLHCAHFAAH